MWEYSSNPGGSIQPGNPAFRSPNLAMRDGDWKLLMNADSTDIKLFDLKNDPGEQQNLADQNVERVREMAAGVLAWRRSMPVDIP